VVNVLIRLAVAVGIVIANGRDCVFRAAKEIVALPVLIVQGGHHRLRKGGDILTEVGQRLWRGGAVRRLEQIVANGQHAVVDAVENALLLAEGGRDRINIALILLDSRLLAVKLIDTGGGDGIVRGEDHPLAGGHLGDHLLQTAGKLGKAVGH